MKKFSNRRGFTLVEMLVAITIFSIIVSIASGVFIRSLRAQRLIVNLMAINDNASQAVEQMAREIRTGILFTATSTAEISFVNTADKTVAYRCNSTTQSLDRGVDGVFKPITSAEVKLRKCAFALTGQSVSDSQPARVTVTLGIGSDIPEIQGTLANIQTTVSQRNLDE